MELPSQNENRSVEDEYLQVLATQASRVPFPVFLVAIIIGSMAAEHFPIAIYGGWVAILLLVLVIRWKVLTRLPDRNDIPINTKVKIGVFLSLLNGVLHASSLGFFPDFTVAERSIQTLMLAGLMTGAVATTAGHVKTYLAFSIPIIIALAITWALFPLPDVSQWIRFGVPVLLAFLGLILIGLAREYSRFFVESFEIRLKQKKLNAQLQDALEDAISANEAKTRFLASASHDLRQPIHALSLFSGALSRRKHDEQTTEIITHLNTAVDNLAAQMSSLLDMSKLDAGLVETHMETLDLQAYLEQLYVEFKQETEQKQLDLHLIGVQKAYVQTDRELFDRVMRNLLSNALRYTNTGSISIELESYEQFWTITIRDTGQGIPAKEQKLIFEEFYQINNPHRDRKHGLGLGLSIVRRLTELLDMQMDLESTENVGTAFSLTLPKLELQLTTKPANHQIISIEGTYALCIDDEENVRFALKTLLGDLGCKVETASGTADAIETARIEKPDIVIADLRLANGDNGLAAIETLRNMHDKLPALLITGDTAPDRLKMAASAGIPVLHKPVGTEELTRAIHNELNWRSKANGDTRKPTR